MLTRTHCCLNVFAPHLGLYARAHSSSSRTSDAFRRRARPSMEARGALHGKIISKRRTSLAFSLAFLAYFALLVDAYTQNITISSVKIPQNVSLSLRPNVHYRFRLLPSAAVVQRDLADTELFLQWVPQNPASVAPIALLSSNNSLPNIRFEGFRSKPTARLCSQKWPCFDSDFVDEASFFAKPGYAFLQTYLSYNTSVLLYMHGGDGEERGQFVISPRHKKRNQALICGGRNGLSCSNQGECKGPGISGVCSCNSGRTGRFCEDKLNVWTGCPTATSSVKKLVVLAPNTWVYYSFVERTDCAPTPTTYRDFDVRFDKRKLVYVVIKSIGASESCSSQFLPKGNSPSLADFENCGAGAGAGKGRVIKVQKDGFKDSIFGFYSKERTRITMSMEACAKPECASSVTFNGFHFLILPIILCFLVAALVIGCVLLYFDRIPRWLVCGRNKSSEPRPVQAEERSADVDRPVRIAE